jgi:EmrB/QacA subfamily drug resistance transporter
MSTPPATASSPVAATQRTGSSRMILGIILACQLMIGLDVTIVNVALPKVQASLHFSTTGLSWVLNIYALAFGGLVLLGGRSGDILGRRRVFLSGIALFGVASLVGGLSTRNWELVTARGVQGLAAALAAPSALALLMLNFPDAARRTRALAYYSIVTALGTTVGLILGGILVSYASWRWVLFVNVPVAVAVVALTPMYIGVSLRHPGRFDLGGALTSTVGMGLLIFGFVHAATNGWGSGLTVAALIGAVVLLALFLLLEANTSQPVTPIWLFKDRNRAGGYVNIFLLMAAMYSLYFFGTQFVENVLGYSPLKAGFSFLVTTLAAVLAARATAKLLPHFGAKRVLVTAAALTVAGSIWMTQLSATISYAAGLVGPLLLFGLGMGLSFPALNAMILAGIQLREMGAASGLLQAMQFVGGTLGLSVLVTIFGIAERNVAQHPPAAATPHTLIRYMLSHGIASAYIVGTIFTICTLIVAIVVIKEKKSVKSA